MSIVPGLEWDCFISYRRLDDFGRGQQPGHGWVSRFYSEMFGGLRDWLGQDPKIFIDARLDRDAELPSELHDTAASSAVLVPIVSPGYYKSTWCPLEFAAFREAAEREGRWSIGNRMAIKKIVKTPLDNKLHQTYPVDDIGHCFFREDVLTGKWDIYKPRSAKYKEEVNDFVQETQRLLKDLANARTQKQSNGSLLVPSAARNREVMVACDAIGFDRTAPVRLVSCVVVDQADVLSKRMERFRTNVAKEPGLAANSDGIDRLAQRGLRYEDDEPELRDRVADQLAILPWDGYVSFADSAFWNDKTDADIVLELLRGVVFDRVRGLIGESIRLVLSPRFAPFWQNVSGVALKYRQEIAALDSVKVVGTSELFLAEPTNAAVEVANYLGGITGARLFAPEDVGANRRFAKIYPNKLRTLRDLRTDTRYSSRHKDLPPGFGVR